MNNYVVGSCDSKENEKNNSVVSCLTAVAIVHLEIQRERGLSVSTLTENINSSKFTLIQIVI